MTYEKIIKKFDKDIWWQKKSYLREDNCPSYWRKQIFMQSVDLDISDWKIIRVGDYYQKRDNYEGIKRDKFILKKILEYKGMY
jgi:hypothetical protein